MNEEDELHTDTEEEYVDPVQSLTVKGKGSGGFYFASTV